MNSPGAIAIATDFRIDDVESRLTGKVFQVLEIAVKPCPKVQ